MILEIALGIVLGFFLLVVVKTLIIAVPLGLVAGTFYLFGNDAA
jgi:hypothetical protein